MILRSGMLGSRPGDALTGSPKVLDGGTDAPLDEQSNRFFKHLTIGIVAVLGGLFILALLLNR